MSYDWDDLTDEDIEWMAIRAAWRATLGLNLAVAGALAEAFDLGVEAIYWRGRNDMGEWEPNVRGDAAPGWTP
jgi:hypothetical protein